MPALIAELESRANKSSEMESAKGRKRETRRKRERGRKREEVAIVISGWIVAAICHLIGREYFPPLWLQSICFYWRFQLESLVYRLGGKCFRLIFWARSLQLFSWELWRKDSDPLETNTESPEKGRLFDGRHPMFGSHQTSMASPQDSRFALPDRTRWI